MASLVVLELFIRRASYLTTMVSIFIFILLAIVFTEATWKWFGNLTKYVSYYWIGMGAGWSAALSSQYLPQAEGFHWQQFMFAFVGVFLFMLLHTVYARLRGRSPKA